MPDHGKRGTLKLPEVGAVPPPLPAPPPELQPALEALYAAVVRGLMAQAARRQE